MTDDQREYQMLDRAIQALCRQLRSRKRADIACRDQVQQRVQEVRTKQNALLDKIKSSAVARILEATCKCH